jgi:hypothetical protein
MRASICFLIATLLVTTNTFAAEDWKYPGDSVGDSGVANSGDQKLATYWSQEIDHSVDRAIKWLAKKLSDTSLPRSLKNYQNRKPGSPDLSTGTKSHIFSGGDKPSRSVTIVYTFSPTNKHVTALYPDESGDMIVISISGSDKGGTIHGVRNFKRKP